MRRLLVGNFIGMILILVVFDVAAYRFLPERMLVAFPEYRRPPAPVDPLLGPRPHGYYVAHANRGFDVGLGRTSRSYVDGTIYPVWSNALGCFDREHGSDSAYVYLAGDSFTWGYGAYGDKYGTIIESMTGTATYKCGVEHTGQRHQLSKMADIVATQGRAPKAVFVFHFENDVANDFAHPHSTVIDGYLVDAVATTAAHQLIHRSTAELSRRLASETRETEAEGKAAAARQATVRFRIRRRLTRYSMTANLVRAVLRRPAPAQAGTEQRHAGATQVDTAEQNLYTVPYLSNGKYWYLANPFAIPNQQALIGFKEWCREHGSTLVVVLLPRRRERFDPDFYAEMHSFLGNNGIRYMDLGGVFAARGVRPGDLYWREDAHFNRKGNRLVAEVLLDSFPTLLGNRRAMPGGKH